MLFLLPCVQLAGLDFASFPSCLNEITIQYIPPHSNLNPTTRRPLDFLHGQIIQSCTGKYLMYAEFLLSIQLGCGAQCTAVFLEGAIIMIFGCKKIGVRLPAPELPFPSTIQSFYPKAVHRLNFCDAYSVCRLYSNDSGVVHGAHQLPVTRVSTRVHAADRGSTPRTRTVGESDILFIRDAFCLTGKFCRCIQRM
jgi:hypothetical protein